MTEATQVKFRRGTTAEVAASIVENEMQIDTTKGVLVVMVGGVVYEMARVDGNNVSSFVNDFAVGGAVGAADAVTLYANGAGKFSTGSSGAVPEANSDDFIVEADGSSGGISLLNRDGATSRITWSTPTGGKSAEIKNNYSNGEFRLNTSKVGASMLLGADDTITNLTLSGASGSESAVFAGTVTVTDGLEVGDTSKASAIVYIKSSATGESELRMGDTDTDAGSIAYNNNDDEMGFRAGAGLRLLLGSQKLYPNADDYLDIGKTDKRIKDIYLSGGVYLGGTAAANLLDDYEEGTWTPVIGYGTVTVSMAVYTKIGRTVTLQSSFSAFSDQTTAAGISFTGLPFNATSDAPGAFMGRYFGKTGSMCSYIGVSNVVFYESVSAGTWDALGHDDLNNASAYIKFQTTYQAT